MTESVAVPQSRTVHQPVREYRITLRFWLIAGICTPLFAVMGIVSTWLALTNADGSFPNPRLFATVLGIFWSMFTLLGLWMLGTCWRTRLVFDRDSIFQQRCFTSSTIDLSGVQQIIWSMYPAGGSIIVKSLRKKIRIELGTFTQADQLEIMKWVRDTFPDSMQAGWDRFHLRWG